MTRPWLRKPSPNEPSAYPNRLPGRRPPAQIVLSADTRRAAPAALAGRERRCREPFAAIAARPKRRIASREATAALRHGRARGAGTVAQAGALPLADRCRRPLPLRLAGSDRRSSGATPTSSASAGRKSPARLRSIPAAASPARSASATPGAGSDAWWPIEGSNVRVPVELTALPVFGGDQSFQGYRGFGILRPAEALMPAAFEARFGTANAPPAEQVPPYEESRRQAPRQRRADPLRHGAHRRPCADAAGAQRLRGDRRGAARAGGRRAARPQTMRRLPETPATEEASPVASTPEPTSVEPVASACGCRSADDSAGQSSNAVRSRPTRQRAAFADATTAARDRDPEDHRRRRARSALGAQLAEAERRLREMTAILDTATDGVIILDARGRHRKRQRQRRSALRARRARDAGRSRFGDLLTPDEPQARRSIISPA